MTFPTVTCQPSRTSNSHRLYEPTDTIYYTRNSVPIVTRMNGELCRVYLGTDVVGGGPEGLIPRTTSNNFNAAACEEISIFFLNLAAVLRGRRQLGETPEVQEEAPTPSPLQTRETLGEALTRTIHERTTT